MRATSTFRQGNDGKYDPKVGPKGDREEGSNRDNFRVAPGATHVLLDEKGPGSDHPHLAHVLGPEPQDWAKNGSANHQEMLLRIYWDGRRAARRRGAGRRLLRQLLRPAQRGGEPAGRRRGRRLLQLLLAHAVSQVGPDRDRQPEREADQPALLQHRLDQEARRIADDTPYFYAQYRQEYPARARTGLRGAGDQRARATTSARSWPCAPAARPGSAKGTRRSTSTARRSRRSGAPAPRTTSCRPGD